MRELCSSLLLAYILHYPVGEDRVERKHIKFLVANISYEHETGRLAVLRLIEVWPARVTEARVQSRVQVLHYDGGPPFTLFFFKCLISFSC